jgi:hypothetical protein
MAREFKIFFKNDAYLKDLDLEILSRDLGFSLSGIGQGTGSSGFYWTVTSDRETLDETKLSKYPEIERIEKRNMN